MTMLIWSFLIPYPMGTSLLPPQTKPGCSMPRTAFSRASMSVSSSQGFTSRVTTDYSPILNRIACKPGKTNLGDCLGLVGLLFVVGSNTRSLKLLGLGILFLIRPEEIDLIVLLSSSRGWCTIAEEGLASRAGARKRIVLSRVRLDVLVPPGDVGVGRSIRLSADRLEYDDVGLRRDVAND